MLVTVGVMSTAIWGGVEALKSLLLQWGWFQSRTVTQQGLILQLIAWGIGAIAGFSYQINALAEIPAFSGVPLLAAYIITGLIAGTGSAGLHIIFAVLGIRGAVTGEALAAEPKQLTGAQGVQSKAIVKSLTYVPWA